MLWIAVQEIEVPKTGGARGNTRHGQAFSILIVLRAYKDPDGRIGWTDMGWDDISFPSPSTLLFFDTCTRLQGILASTFLLGWGARAQRLTKEWVDIDWLASGWPLNDNHGALCVLPSPRRN